MNPLQKIIFGVFCFVGIFLSCQEATDCTAAPGSKVKIGKYTIRQDSELTVLMKEMEEDFKRMKADIAAGKQTKPGLNYSKILTAHGTDAGEVPSESYQAFAKNFLQVLEGFEKSEFEKSAEMFENLVTSCKNCHQIHCRGQ